MKNLYLLVSALVLALSANAEKLTSFLEVINTQTGERKIVKTFQHKIEAPNWTPDGKWLVYNSGGRLYKISPDAQQEPILIDTGFANSCNNDHVLSADGRQIAISHHTKEDGAAHVE